MVVGPDSNSVQRAREMLELQEECIPLESYQIEWLGSRFNSAMLSTYYVVVCLFVCFSLVLFFSFSFLQHGFV
jgi:hypothetical protein